MLLDIVKADAVTFGSKPSSSVDILRRVCLNAFKFDKGLNDLTQNMIDTMFAANGVGLAAPQVGIDLNLFVMRTAKGLENDSRDVHIIINPAVISTSNETYVDMEGCLSIPNIRGYVTRNKSILFSYVNSSGQHQQASLSGFSARIFQHENDHLNGWLFTDRTDELWKKIKNEELGTATT